MRKLSKKISMLMVLAMLVSLFSGVVSASAASSWSFYNKTDDAIVEVKDSIEMESNQFADFDLYKDGKAFDTDVYTVKYESSDEDVVWVDAKNGKLRADKYGKAEAGDKAVVSAKIENKNTGAKTTKSFTIVIAEEEVEVEYAIVSDMADEVYLTGEKYALKAVVTADGVATDDAVVLSIDGAAITEFAPTKAGDVTIVATATIDGEEITEKFVVTVKESVPEVVAAKQTALNTVAVTFNSAAWAKKAAESLNTFKVTYKSNDQDITDYIKSVAVDANDANTVLVTLYNDLSEKVPYTFAFVGYDCAVTVVGADAKPVEIKVIGGKVVVADESDASKVVVKAYNSIGADVTSKVIGAYYVNYTSADLGIANVYGDKVYFYEAGKSVAITAELEMGYDENGVKIPNLKATGVYTSVPAYTDSALKSFKIDTTADNWWVGYGNNLSNIAVGDTGKYLYAKFDRVFAAGNSQEKKIFSGNCEGNSYTYYSSNEAVALIDQSTGLIRPGSAGTTTLYVKNAQNQVIGSVLVTVAAGRNLTTLSASVDTYKLSTGTANVAGDQAKINVSAKDQLGDGIAVNYTMQLAAPKNGKTLADYFTNIAVDGNGVATVAPDGNGNIYLSGSAANLRDKESVQITIKIVAAEAARSWVKKEQNVTLTLKNVNGEWTASNLLSIDKTSVDTKISNDADNAWKYDVNIKVVGKDSAQFHTIDNSFITVDSMNDVSVATGVYSLYIVDPNGNAFTADGAATTSYTINTVTVNGNVLEKMKAGTYKVYLYKGNGTKYQQVGYQTITITDSTPKLTAKATTAYIDSFTDANVLGALKFYRNGNGTTWNVDKNVVGTEVRYVVTTDNNYNRQFVQKVIVYTKASELLGYSWDGKFVRNEVDVNQLFYLK